QCLMEEIVIASATDAPVLITGESGTGKDLVAQAIHRQSSRSHRSFVALNSASLDRTFIASTLFGHERGAFTGASSQRIGKFEMADGGVLFFDEIGDMPLELQPDLLRVLETGRIE